MAFASLLSRPCQIHTGMVAKGRAGVNSHRDNPAPSESWFDESHVAVAKVAGYSKWFNAVGPDMIKEKMGDREGHNHYVNNPRGTVITPEMVLA